ncbi:hypothetical protein SAMN05216417_102274 [Nitrosospira multiformis]|uniref:Lipoprotein n=2 Tax=Nitrosospira multiformis TaxID=1231 RepID=A0A1I7FW22_9PROT|nr:hypothetical protein SAMN05216417_102274 [Nitrosospira multiformis]
MRAIAAILLVTTILGCTPTTTSQKESQPPSPPSPPPSTSTPPPTSTAPSPSPAPQPTRPVYNLTGYSPSFKDGYIDGCETAKKTANGAKDEQRFAGDKQYRLGWNDGFSLCGRNRAEK